MYCKPIAYICLCGPKGFRTGLVWFCQGRGRHGLGLYVTNIFVQHPKVTMNHWGTKLTTIKKIKIKIKIQVN